MEFRKMRRGRQELPKEACEEVLSQNTAGVLAVLGDGGYPYAVPLSYVYQDGALYFHCAKEGHKLEALQNCPKASFCVVDQDEIVPEKYTTYFRSVIAFGRIRLLEAPEEKRRAIELLARRYAPEDTPANRDAAIDREFAPLCMLELSIEHLSGKEAIELVKARRQ